MTDSQDELRDVPVIIEFVAVPNTFDIEYYLSMRESTGMFINEEMNLTHIKFISDTIKSSPWFVLSKAPDLTIASCLFCLEVFREIGLTIESISDQHEDSKFRGQDYKRFLHYHYKDRDNQTNKQMPFSITIVNLYQLVQEGILKPVIEKIVEIEDYVEKIEGTMEMVKENQK